MNNQRARIAANTGLRNSSVLQQSLVPERPAFHFLVDVHPPMLPLAGQAAVANNVMNCSMKLVQQIR